VDFVIYKLGKRLNNPHWVVALKSLMVYHRLMRECDPSFQEQVRFLRVGVFQVGLVGGWSSELKVCSTNAAASKARLNHPFASHRIASHPTPLSQLLRFCDRTGRQRMLCLDRYADQTSRETWDYSAWVRSYGVFLDERLDAFRWVRGVGGIGLDLGDNCSGCRLVDQGTGSQLASELDTKRWNPPPATLNHRAIRFDPESGAHAARQQQASQYGGYGGPTGGAYGGATGAAYGGATGAAYGGATGAAYGGATGAAYGGATGAAYGGATGAYGSGHANGGASSSANGQQPAVAAVSLKDCSATELLERLPRMQRLMLRMLACVPDGAAAYNPLCLVGLIALVARGFG